MNTIESLTIEVQQTGGNQSWHIELDNQETYWAAHVREGGYENTDIYDTVIGDDAAEVLFRAFKTVVGAI